MHLHSVRRVTPQKKQEVNERKAPKPKYYGKKCKNAQRSAVKYVAGGRGERVAAWWVEPSKRGSAAAQSWRSEMQQQQQPRHLHALQ